MEICVDMGINWFWGICVYNVVFVGWEILIWGELKVVVWEFVMLLWFVVCFIFVKLNVNIC